MWLQSLFRRPSRDHGELLRLLTDWTVNPGISHPLVRDAVKQCADVLAAKTLDRRAASRAYNAAMSAFNTCDRLSQTNPDRQLVAALNSARGAAAAVRWAAEGKMDYAIKDASECAAESLAETKLHSKVLS